MWHGCLWNRRWLILIWIEMSDSTAQFSNLLQSWA